MTIALNPSRTRVAVASLQSRWLVPSAWLAFALSGVAGLIYQSIWTQYLGLFLGHAAYAQSLVLAIFMGGMAIGAWWASRRGTDWRNLLRAYALVEIVIGVAAALFHREFLAATTFAYDTVFPALAIGWSSTAFKWLCATLLILPQAILLGTTFPLMSNALMRRSDAGDGSILSGLYFTNSFGAACGALLATFALVPAFGLPGAMRTGALFSLLAGLLALAVSRTGEESADASTPETAAVDPVRGVRIFLAAAFVTGASSFVYEIGWVRMLSLALGSTVHAFELMLAAFIGGLAFGGWSIRKRIDGYADVMSVAGHVQILMGLAALASLLLYDQSFNWVEWLMATLPRTDSGYAAYNLVSALVAMAIMAPTAFFAGMTLPLFTLAVLRRGGGEGSVGRVYSANTVGAIAGVLVAVHLLLPSLGLKLAMVLAAGTDLVLGLVLLRRSIGDGVASAGRRRTYPAMLLLAGVAAALTLLFARFDPLAMTAGVYRVGASRQARGQQVVFYRDGKTASIGVRHRSDGSLVIATNGKPDASINMVPGVAPTMDEITMVMAAALPLSIHQAPRDIANIGFGSGLTTQTLLADPRVRQVDDIEIEPMMIEGAKMFRPAVERAYSDPRSHIVIEDARSYFTAQKTRYDVIVSEPSNPWVSGVASLFSREFYRFVPGHLKPGGLFVQWVQLYEINDELVGTIISALEQSFADYRVYLSNYGDMIMVARADGPIGDVAPAGFEAAELRAMLFRQGIAADGDLRFHELGDRASLSPLFHVLSHRTNSDFFPILTLEAPRARFRNEVASTLVGLPTADLPYVELLSKLSLPAREISVTSAFDRTVMRQGAHRLVAARDGSRPAGLAAEEALMMLAIHESVGRCRGHGAAQDQIGALRQAAAETIPYLAPADLRNLWIAPDWIDCDKQAVPVRDFLQLLAALANRDHAGSLALARTMLGRDRAGLAADDADYVLRAGMLAAIAAGDPRSALQLDAQYGAITPTDAPSANYRRWMLQIAREQVAGRTGIPAGDLARQP